MKQIDRVTRNQRVVGALRAGEVLGSIADRERLKPAYVRQIEWKTRRNERQFEPLTDVIVPELSPKALKAIQVKCEYGGFASLNEYVQSVLAKPPPADPRAHRLPGQRLLQNLVLTAGCGRKTAEEIVAYCKAKGIIEV